MTTREGGLHVEFPPTASIVVEVSIVFKILLGRLNYTPKVYQSQLHTFTAFTQHIAMEDTVGLPFSI